MSTDKFREAQAFVSACFIRSRRAALAEKLKPEEDWKGNDIEFRTRSAVLG